MAPNYGSILMTTIANICTIFDVTVSLDDTIIQIDRSSYRVVQWYIIPDNICVALIAKDSCGNYVLFRGKLIGENKADIQRNPYRGASINAWAKRWLENQGGNNGN